MTEQVIDRIRSWREMEPGYWYYIGMETRGTNKMDKPIVVVTVKSQLGGQAIKFYAPPSLYYALSFKPDTKAFLYEGLFPGASDCLYPRYTFSLFCCMGAAIFFLLNKKNIQGINGQPKHSRSSSSKNPRNYS